MKAALVSIIALLSCGFYVLTPKQGEQLKTARMAWHSVVARRFDQGALHAFLVERIAEVKKFGDLELKMVRIGSTFRPDPDAFYLMDSEWIFVSRDPHKDEFELRSMGRFEGRVVLHCVRNGKRTFKVIEITSDDEIWLCPPAYSLGP